MCRKVGRRVVQRGERGVATKVTIWPSKQTTYHPIYAITILEYSRIF